MGAHRKSIAFSIILTSIFCIILQGCAVTKSECTLSESDVRQFLTLDIWQDNVEIEEFITVLEMLDENKVDKAKKRLQELLYISVAISPEWEEMVDESLYGDALKAERLALLKRIKKYHEKHKDEIDMRLPSNRRVVLQLERIDPGDSHENQHN